MAFTGGTKGFCNLEIVFEMLFKSTIHSVKSWIDFGLPDTFDMLEETVNHFGNHGNQKLKLVS